MRYRGLDVAISQAIYRDTISHDIVPPVSIDGCCYIECSLVCALRLRVLARPRTPHGHAAPRRVPSRRCAHVARQDPPRPSTSAAAHRGARHPDPTPTGHVPPARAAAFVCLHLSRAGPGRRTTHHPLSALCLTRAAFPRLPLTSSPTGLGGRSRAELRLAAHITARTTTFPSSRCSCTTH